MCVTARDGLLLSWPQETMTSRSPNPKTEPSIHNVVIPPALHVLTLSALPAPAGCFPFLLVSVPWPAPARHQTPALIIATVSPADAHAARVASKLSGKPERCSLITVIMPRSPPPPPMPSTGSGVQARWWAPSRVCAGADPAWSLGRPACCPACQTCPSPSSSSARTNRRPG